MRAAFVTTLAVATVASACGSSSADRCPADGTPCRAGSPPVPKCDQFEGFTVCTDGVWCLRQPYLNPPSPPAGLCPPTAPAGGTTCSAGYAVCEYQCTSGDRHGMVCHANTWCGNTPSTCILASLAPPPPPDAGYPDAGQSD